MRSEAGMGEETHAAVLKLRRNLIVMAVCVVAFCFPTVATTYDGELWRHPVSVISHANIFHLLANLYCVWLMKFPARWLTAFVIGITATFVPAPVWSWGEMGFVLMPTCGLSGVILAAVAMEWARVGGLKKMMKYLVLPILPLTLIPNINTPIHLYCIAGGYVLGRFLHRPNSVVGHK
jgi:hypothetical protein